MTLGWYVLRINSGGMPTQSGHFIKFAPAGTPDLICCSPSGKFVGIEVKVPGNKPTEPQKETLQKITQMNGVGLWASSLEEVLADLKLVGLLS